MLPWIYKPTRETDSTATLIDNIFTNNFDVNDQLYQGVFLMDISDHYGIFHILDEYCEHDDCSQLLRVINESKMDRYRECILNIDWNALDVYEDCESYYKHFIDKFKNVYDHVFPIITVKKRYRNRLPWLATGLKESIKHETSFLRFHGDIQLLTIKHYIKIIAIRSLLCWELLRSSSTKGKLLRIRMRKTWGIIKQVINRNKNNKICDKFISENNIT